MFPSLQVGGGTGSRADLVLVQPLSADVVARRAGRPLAFRLPTPPAGTARRRPGESRRPHIGQAPWARASLHIGKFAGLLRARPAGSVACGIEASNVRRFGNDTRACICDVRRASPVWQAYTE